MKPWLRSALVVLVLGVALFALIVGLQSKGEEPEPIRVAGLVRVFPDPGVVALRQDAFGAELEFGYSGRLTIDRIAIPDDQIDRIAGINRISFMPGPGKEISALDEGRHCASVIFWPTAAGEDGAGPPREWCFIAA